jgi:hypothetical protein
VANTATPQPTQGALSSFAMPNGVMEMSMMTVAQMSALTTLMMSQFFPRMGKALDGSSTAGVFPFHRPVTPSQNHPSSEEPASSPFAPNPANNVTLDEFIDESGFEEFHTQIEGLGWTPGECANSLAKDPAMHKAIFGLEHLAWKPAHWKCFTRAAAKVRKQMKSN